MKVSASKERILKKEELDKSSTHMNTVDKPRVQKLEVTVVVWDIPGTPIQMNQIYFNNFRLEANAINSERRHITLT